MGTFHWTVATGDIVWSGTYLQLHGLPPGAQGSYEGWLASLHPEDREPADRQIRLAMENHTDFDTEYRIPWPDGTQRSYVAEDCGSGVHGNHIEVFFNDHQAARVFGVQNAMVYLEAEG